MTPEDLPIRCPECGNRDARSSDRRSFLDGIMRIFHMVPYRCRVCRRRFYDVLVPGRRKR